MKSLILGLTGAFLLLGTITTKEALAVKTEIKASGNVSMNGALKAYQDNVLQSVTKECLAQNAAKATLVSLSVDPRGNIMRIVLTNSGLSSDQVVNLITALKGLKLGDAGDNQSDTLRITMDFDLAEVLAGAKSTGTSISITGGSITGDGTASGGIRIGGAGSISSGAGSDGANGQLITSGVISRPRQVYVTEDAVNKVAALEKSPDRNLQELCNARLVLLQQYWRSQDLAKARELLEQALKYLDGPAGPLSRETTRNLERIMPLLVSSSEPGDKDLEWRVYAAIEKKAQNGCTDSDLARLARLDGPTGAQTNGEDLVSILSRLLELREMREGTGSSKLLPILTLLATTDESLHKNDAAAQIQQRIAKIHKQMGTGGDVEAIDLLTLARQCVLGEKFAEAASNEKSALDIAAQSQGTNALKLQIAARLGTLSDAYISKGDRLGDADRVVREAIAMAAGKDLTGHIQVFDCSACTTKLTERYRQLKEFSKAIDLLEYLLEKTPAGASKVAINTWRYQLAQLYLDESNAASGKSSHRSKGVKDLQHKSNLYFDTAQDAVRNDPTLGRSIFGKFVIERIEALKKCGLPEEANQLEIQNNSGQ